MKCATPTELALHDLAREVVNAYAENVSARLEALFGQDGPDPIKSSERLGRAIDALDTFTR